VRVRSRQLLYSIWVKSQSERRATTGRDLKTNSETYLPRPQSLHRKPRMARSLGRDDDRLDLRVVEYFLKVGLAAVCC
jgi:hypothetical protein